MTTRRPRATPAATCSDRGSNWSREAQTLGGTGGGNAGGNAGGGNAGSAAPAARTAPMPSINGAELGAARSRLVAALGEPDGGQDAAGTVWRYPARGLTVLLDEEGRSKMFIVESRAGGALGGVTVGDRYDAVTRAQGQLDLEQQAQQGTVYRWNRGGWNLLTIVNNGAVIAVGAGRN